MQKPTATSDTEHKEAKLAQNVLTLMESLTAIMDQEVESLGKKDYAAMEPLRQEKLKMVREYQGQMAVIAEHNGGLKSLPPERRQRLRDVGLRLAQTSKRNAIALKSAITGTQSFLQTIMSAAQKQSLNMESYTDPRKARGLLGAYSPTANPVAVDRTA